MTRAFVAIPLPDREARSLAEVAAACPGGRTVDEDDLHITLAFLDELTDAALEEMDDALQSIRAPAFELRIGGLGTFGGARPRSVWAAVTLVPELSDLQKSVRRMARKTGLDLPHRRFVPHVTLARYGPSAAFDPTAFARYAEKHAALNLGPFPIRAFVLYASFLTSDGARYTELSSYPLLP